ncbi:hypothetical protein [Aureimonas jatrophae]|uniref:Uncharacterized protein n=1 Tax=Aureimonas jatrophae TaxID=1166073 RepID=A0A1H0FRV1_9HYPH|nr:hypothetical protein [Aureimonas jatrophae]MBB3950479.1 hypothetical protein [Aureimonas jatrophae]SDN97377.1 hypothetical protein SAMN05192530_102645 [Aureimonas jatrophae]
MPVLNIEGRRVRVDDSFLQLSPEDQNRTVDEIASSIGVTAKREQEPQPSALEAGQFGGAAMNAAAGANEALYTVAGAPVDLMRGAMNIGIRGYNAATGSEVDQIPDTSFGGSRHIAETLGAIRPELDPQNTVARDTGDRLARAAGQGAGYAVAPVGALGAASRAGIVAPQAEAMATRILGGSGSVGEVAGNAIVGAGSGAGAQAAMEATPDAYDPVSGLAGGIAAGGTLAAAGGIPGLLRTTGRAVGDYLAPTTQAGRERLAAQRLQRSASDLEGARDQLADMPDELVPGSQPTTGQVTGDMGLLALERGAAVKRPEAFAQRRADQNEARLGALDGLQQGGAPEKVAEALRSRLRSIDDTAEQAIADARRGAQDRAVSIGQGTGPEASGERVRASLEAARARAKAEERALWSAVDPDGSLVIGTDGIRSQAARERGNLTLSAKPPSGEEAAIYDVIEQYGEVMPFREVTDLQSRIKSEMRAERLANGETPAYARLSRANNAIQQQLERVTLNKALQEQGAVARGEMRVENTLAAALRREQERWIAERAELQAAGGDGPRGFAGNGGGRSPAVSGSPRAEGQTRGQPRDVARDPRLSRDDLVPNFDDAALGRLTVARDATRNRAETFDNRTLGPIRQRSTATGPYATANSTVPGRIFYPRADSAEAIAQFRRAVGDGEALPILQDYAVDRLRAVAMREDGTLDPGKVDRWRRAHADALRSFPELDRTLADAGRISDAMGNVVKRQKAVQAEMSKGALGRLLQVEDPGDVTRTVGSIFGAQDATGRMRQLRAAIGSDEEAQKGLRQAVADHIRLQLVGNTEAGTSGLGTIKADQFQTFMRKNAAALQAAGFSGDEIATMQAIATDLQQANRSLSSVKMPGGSDTTQNLYSAGKGDGQPSILARLLSNAPTAAGGVGGFVAGGPLAAFAGAVGAKTVADLRSAGIATVDDLVADALLNPGRARILLSKPTTRKSEEDTLRLLGQVYRRSVATSGAVATGGNVAMVEGSQDDRRKPLEVTVERSR